MLGLNTFHTATCLPHACMPVVWHCQVFSCLLTELQDLSYVKVGLSGVFLLERKQQRFRKVPSIHKVSREQCLLPW